MSEKKKPDIQKISDFLDFEGTELHEELKRRLDHFENSWFEHFFNEYVNKKKTWSDLEIEALVSLKIRELKNVQYSQRKMQVEAYRVELAREPTEEQAHKLAFNKRITYYYKHFVDHYAKHTGTQLELDICYFFRRVKGNVNTTRETLEKLPILESAWTEYQSVIARLGIEESRFQALTVASSASSASTLAASASTLAASAPTKSWHRVSWVIESANKKEPFINDSAARDKRFEYCATLFRSIQAVTLTEYLEQCERDGTQIDVVDPNRNLRRISIDRNFIVNVPRLARCMKVARQIEKIAFTSSLHISTQDALSAAHDIEQEKSEDIDVMEWNATPESILEMISQISTLIQKKMFKKYLKYKNKYLSLKKQITL
jgi:hypothetical protein